MESRPDGRRHPGASPALRGWPGGGGSSAVTRRLPPVLTAPLITTLALHRIFQNETFAIKVIRPWLSEGMGWGQLLRRKPPSTSRPSRPLPPAPRPPALDGPERGSGQGGGHHGPCSQLLCDRTRSIFRISSAEKLPHCGVTSTFLLSAVGASPWDQGPGGPRRLSPFAWCYSWPRNPGEHSSLL